MDDAGVDVQALGAAIQHRRELRGWTTYRLSEKAGVSNVYLRTIEQGRAKRIGVGIVAKVAHALGISTDDLLADVGIDAPIRPAVPGDLATLYAELDVPARRAALQHLRVVRDLQAEYAARQEEELPPGVSPLEPRAAVNDVADEMRRTLGEDTGDTGQA